MENVSFQDDKEIYNKFIKIVANEERRKGDCLREALREWMYKYKDKHPNLMPPAPPQTQQPVISMPREQLQNAKEDAVRQYGNIEFFKKKANDLRVIVYKDPNSQINLEFERAIIEFETEKAKLRTLLKNKLMPQSKLYKDKKLQELIEMCKTDSDYKDKKQ